MNIARLLQRAGQTGGDRIALYQGTRPLLGHAALADAAARLAGGLRDRLGLAAGDRVALVMTNCPDYIALLFACWHAGLVAVPVNAKLHAREIAFILENSGARAVFVTPDLAATLQDALPGLPMPPLVLEVGSRELRALATGDALALQPVAPDAPAWLFYTSGTTGRPKGAMLTHHVLLAMTLNYFTDVDSIAPQDAVLHAAPMSHGSGLYILPHVCAAAAQIIPESGHFEPAEIATLMRHHKGVAMFAAPTMVGRMVRWDGIGSADLSGLKTITYGGGPMYLEDCKQALAVLGQKLVQIYGQGESPMTITVLPRHLHGDVAHPRYEARLASVGFAQSVVEMRVVDPEGQDVPVGETGEVIVRGDTVMAGYWQNPDATAAALRDGWLWTGDLGVLDADGFLTLKDRSKDLIISGGTNIYPREVEEVLLQHPAVAEVAVVGRRHPDWGEEVMAFIVTAPGQEVDAAALDALCTSQIARFKRPKHYRFVGGLPKNNYGKVLKTELRRMLES